MKKIISPLLLLVSLQSFAQYTIQGRVVSKTDKKPIQNAVVFINNSAIAGTTDSAGHFRLTAVAGQYNLLVNIVGYQKYRTPLTLKGDIVLNDIELLPKADTLKEVTVKAKATISACFAPFEQELFGNTQFARQCKMLNPLVLQFFDITPQGGFSARSNDFLQIENDALGYRIKFMLLYFIKDMGKRLSYFNGECYFEEMKGTPKQEYEWRKNRLECYQGSPMQLMRAIMSDSLAENGFRLKRASRKINPYFDKNGLVANSYDIDGASALADLSAGVGIAAGLGIPDYSDNTRYNDKTKGSYLHGKELLLTTNQKGIYAITGKSAKDTTVNSLYIEHTRDAVPVINGATNYIPWIWGGRVAVFTFNKPYLVFNSDGKLLNPGAINIDGFMLLQSRMATLLPFDYKPVK
jgi:CarboxypepD_reg-like domain